MDLYRNSFQLIEPNSSSNPLRAPFATFISRHTCTGGRWPYMDLSVYLEILPLIGHATEYLKLNPQQGGAAETNHKRGVYLDISEAIM